MSGNGHVNGERLNLVVLGLSITSTWGNGHATNYRALLGELGRRGHTVLFLERDRPWYADNRDGTATPHVRTRVYSSLRELRSKFARVVREADAVIVGSYVPRGVDVGSWVLDTARGATVFYDIDTPVTLAKLRRGDFEYLSPELIPRYDLYLSFTGGPTLRVLENKYGSPRARAFYCLVDPARYYPAELGSEPRVDLGYLGTYSADRQPALERLLLEPAREEPRRRFVVAGPKFPDDIDWPANVKRIDHCPATRHRAFYTSQRFTLNITRRDMVRAGWSPSVRLFEAAACGTPIISDDWPGLETIFEPGREILIARDTGKVLRYLRETSEAERRGIARRARLRVMRQHTAAHRADELLAHLAQVRGSRAAAQNGNGHAANRNGRRSGSGSNGHGSLRAAGRAGRLARAR